MRAWNSAIRSVSINAAAASVTANDVVENMDDAAMYATSSRPKSMLMENRMLVSFARDFRWIDSIRLLFFFRSLFLKLYYCGSWSTLRMHKIKGLPC